MPDMNLRKIQRLLCCLLVAAGAMVSCQKYTYDFTYSPQNPKAGEKVTFTNISEAGENWVWTFGDGGKSTLKNPTHVFISAGTYVVELMADSNKTRRTSHVLEVMDTIPSIYIASDTVQQYASLTMKAALYNPTKSTVTYAWEIDEELFVITAGSLTGDSLTGYFTDYGRTAKVKLTVTLAGKSTTDSVMLTLLDRDAASVLMQTPDGKLWRQRIYDGIYEDARPFSDDPDAILAANDSTATLNGVDYDIHNMPVLTDKEVYALQVDAVNRKIYMVLADGVYVANANGDALTPITDMQAYTLLIAGERNTIYWSTDDGVYVMPLVTNPQNIVSEQLRNKIRLINTIPAIERMITYEH